MIIPHIEDNLDRGTGMVHFVGKKAMEIEGLSEATLDKFYENGWLNQVTDLYGLEMYKEEITALEGFGEKLFANLIESINRSKVTSFEKFLVSLDIPMSGSTASKELKSYFNGDTEYHIFNDFQLSCLHTFKYSRQIYPPNIKITYSTNVGFMELIFPIVSTGL